MPPVRFCMLTTFYPPWSFGGDAIHVQRLSQALTARGHEVTVVYSAEAYRALAKSAPATRQCDGDVRLVGIDAGRGSLSPALTHLSGRPLLARRQLDRALDGPFDVLHYHNPSLLGGPRVLSMGRGLRLYTLHEQWLVCPTHVLFRYQREICVKPRCWSCQLSYRRPPQMWRGTRLLDQAVAGLDALIAPSRTSAVLHHRFANRVRIEHLPHFVMAPPTGNLGPSTRVSDRPFFLYAGRLEPVKGVERVIDLFRRRTSEDLIIAGVGSSEEGLRRHAAGFEHIRFVGQQTESELAKLYRDARAVLIPTAGHEAFGLVAVEALAHGTPVVVPDFGALKELVDESEGGLAYSTDQELADAVALLARDDALRAELGERGRRATAERWSVETYLDRYFALIAELAERRGDARLASRARS